MLLKNRWLLASHFHPLATKRCFASVHKDKSPDPIYAPLLSQDLHSKVNVCDLIISGGDPAVILGLPMEPAGPYTAANARGMLLKIGRSSMDLKLGTLMPTLTQQDCKISKNLETFAEQTNNFVHAPNKPDDLNLWMIDQPLYEAINPVLRGLSKRSRTLALLNRLDIIDIVLLLQKQDEPVVLSYFDFLRLLQQHIWNFKNPEVPFMRDAFASKSKAVKMQMGIFPQRTDQKYKKQRLLKSLNEYNFPADFNTQIKAKFTAPFVMSTRAVLGHMELRNKIILDMQPSGSGSLTILPRKTEATQINVGSKQTSEMLLDKHKPLFLDHIWQYSLGNLSTENVSGESIALSYLRQHPLTCNEPENGPGTAALVAKEAGMLDTKVPMRQKYAYSPVLTPLTDESTSVLSSLFDADYDRLEGTRLPYDGQVYCIDGPDAHEIDDGISVEMRGELICLGVHIVDPSSSVRQSGKLLQELLRKPASTYLHNDVIPMLPSSVGEQFGFEENAERRSLSVFVYIDPIHRRVVKYEVCNLKLTNIKQRTYEEVEQNLNGNSPLQSWKLALECSEILKFKRLETPEARHPFAQMRDQQINFKTGEREISFSKAVQIVTEAMLCASSLFGRYACQKGVANIYRFQELEYGSSAMRDAVHVEARREGSISLKYAPLYQRAHLSITPRAHSSVGHRILGYYTSPLRRGIDLINHFNINAAKLPKGDTSGMIPEKQLFNSIPWLQTFMNLQRSFSQSQQRYDTLLYLEQLRNSNQQGIVTAFSEQHGTASVFLPLFSATAKMETKEKHEIGSHVQVRLSEVNAIKDTLVVVQN